MIHMQQCLINNERIAELSEVRFLVGDIEHLVNIGSIPPLTPFDDRVLTFLNDLSVRLMSDNEARIYPDIVTLGFWLRRASLAKLRERFEKNDGNIHLGRGILFHIAPSNVPVNYAYSLFTGLMTGNINIVRIPSKDFPQVRIINRAINDTLREHQFLAGYVFLVRYDKEKKVNDLMSSLADVRIVWGGDVTINEIRKSPLSPRAGEVTFADRYSLAIIDSEKYIALDNKVRFAEKFYNDTYLTDQNACTSPRVVVWLGEHIGEAKEIFWNTLHTLVREKYKFQPVMGLNKMTSAYIMAAVQKGVRIIPHEDNYIVRVAVTHPDAQIMNFKDNSGYFFEYDCGDIMELYDICNDNRCQTVGFLGEKDVLVPLLKAGIKGVDRVVPIGATMDFDMIWDGYDLYERFTRTISTQI